MMHWIIFSLRVNSVVRYRHPIIHVISPEPPLKSFQLDCLSCIDGIHGLYITRKRLVQRLLRERKFDVRPELFWSLKYVRCKISMPIYGLWQISSPSSSSFSGTRSSLIQIHHWLHRSKASVKLISNWICFGTTNTSRKHGAKPHYKHISKP